MPRRIISRIGHLSRYLSMIVLRKHKESLLTNTRVINYLLLQNYDTVVKCENTNSGFSLKIILVCIYFQSNVML